MSKKYTMQRLFTLIVSLMLSLSFIACSEAATATKAASKTMNELRPMNTEWLRHYLVMWGFRGDDTDESNFAPKSHL